MFKCVSVPDMYLELGPLQVHTYKNVIRYPHRNHTGHCVWNMSCSKFTPGSRDLMLSLAPSVKNDVEGNTHKVVGK